MPGQREDYLMRILEMMGEMLRQVTQLREEGHLPEALSLLIIAQEKLFARPASDFSSLAIADQLRLLSLDEPAQTAQRKYLAYAATLKEAGLIYQARSKDTLAASAFQLALYLTLTVATEPDTPAGDLNPQIRQLMGLVPAEELYPPVKMLLEKMNAKGISP